MSGDDSIEAVRQERDLYLRLLELHLEDRVEDLLRQALDLIVATTHASRGYLELRADDADDAWSMASGLTEPEVESVRNLVSSGIIAEAVATGEIVETTSAMLDERFCDNLSVRENQIGAVLCAPIGVPRPSGVLYLQGGAKEEALGPRARRLVEVFACHFGGAANRVVEATHMATRDDPTASFRARLRLDGIVGRSVALARVLAEVGLAAPLDVSVLLTGPTGTGKTQLARAIHNNGPRASAPFLDLNCAAIPETLFESELFGVAKGAYTGAIERPGRLEQADGGTVFLDEVGDMPIGSQAKLLQFLDTSTFWRVGATAARKASVRVIAATNVDLVAACAEGRFREDLFYRLRVLSIATPSLGERRDDLRALAEHFIDDACRRHKLGAVRLTPSGKLALEEAEWPGNIRQLRNCVESAAIRAFGERAGMIGPRHLFPEQSDGGEEVEGELTWQEGTRRYQRRMLSDALRESGWNVSEAARRLDLTRAHVYNLIAAFGLERSGAM